MSYKRSRTRRRFEDGVLTGDDITNAYGGPKASGEWHNPDLPPWDEEGHDWLMLFFRMALNEVVHEALEWFKVDGKALLDPHGPHDMRIYRSVDALADDLYALARVSSEGGEN